MMLTMSAQPNLLCFSIEGKGTDGQINRATASDCERLQPRSGGWRLPKPAVLQREAGPCAERRSVSASACVRRSGLNAFLLLDDKGREECRGGPPGAELDTLTSARMRSVAHTSRRRGDFFNLFLCFSAAWLIWSAALELFWALSSFSPLYFTLYS